MCSAWSYFAVENVRLFSSLRANDSGSAIDSQLFLRHHSHRHEREDWTGGSNPAYAAAKRQSTATASGSHPADARNRQQKTHC
jgi:hypothetical protein